MVKDIFDYARARQEIVKASFQRNTIEIPTILSCLDFQGLECLEVSRYGDARLPIILSGLVKHITFLVPRTEIIGQVKSSLENAKVQYGERGKVHALTYDLERGFPFRTGSFDLAYGEWLSHSLVQNQRFLREITRVSRRYLLLVMPGLNGDDANLASIAEPKEAEKRKECRKNIENYLKREGWKTSIKEATLKLDFRDEETARKTFYCLTFGNNLTAEQKAKVDNFLSGKRVHNFRNDFYVLLAEKANL
jgi:hypothetical protein